MEIFSLFLLATPAFIANMMPIIAAKYKWFPCLNFSIDFGKTFRGKRIFGDHKTLRGFIVGVFFAVVWSGILFFFFPTEKFEGVYASLLFGFLSGFGALFGDAIKSFFKRQVNIGSGKPFIPFDQIDYIIGFLLFTLFLVEWNFFEIFIFLVFGLLLNPLVNISAYFLGIKKTFW